MLDGNGHLAMRDEFIKILLVDNQQFGRAAGACVAVRAPPLDKAISPNGWPGPSSAKMRGWVESMPSSITSML